MKINLKASPLQEQQNTCVIIGMFQDGTLTSSGQQLDKLTKGYLSKLAKNNLFTGKLGCTLPLYHFPDSQIGHILLVGCGKNQPLTPAAFRKIGFNAIKALNGSPVTQAVCYLTELTVAKFPLTWKIKQLAEVTESALYRFDLFKSDKEPTSLKTLTLHLTDPKEQKASEKALKEGQAIGQGCSLTKNLANLPSNICTPSFLADQAWDLAKQYRTISVKVLEEKDMQKLGMGAFLAVTQGSSEPAKLICLEHKGAAKKQAPVALVGKGITFDTGGISLKPADSMVGMKYDMCGAASVLGTFKAIAELKLPINVVGLIAAAENMPGGTAYKPEDILTSMSGQTIEVISTDAEGRLVLADTLTYCERYHPDVVIDIATLTGAVVIALGFHTTGLLANDDGLAKDLLDASIESHDRAWQLPLWEEYQEQIKSPFADMANTGGRSAGVITAGCFLSRFAKKFRWAHLDVAGTAAMMAGTSERMATGRPVPMLTQYLINRADKE